MDAVFLAADITSLGTNVTTLLVSFVGISLAFLGYRYWKRISNRA